jgi:outer membrane protein insertion porin family
MSRLPFSALALALVSLPAWAQDSTTVGRCATPDSIAFKGNVRVSDTQIRGDAALTPGSQLNFRELQRAVRSLYGTGQFTDDIRIGCDTSQPGRKTILIIEVKERPVLADFRVEGADKVSPKSVKERIEIEAGRPLDPSKVAKAVLRIDSLYESRGYYLARIKPETTLVGDDVKLTFKIDEGRRLAISGVQVHGNKRVPTRDIVKTMQIKPEGFWWWRKGAFDDEKFAGDLGERLPDLYGSRGLIDFRVIKDTLIVDKDRGKALIDVTVEEGPQYRVGNFEALGNRHFSSEDIQRFYPFTGEGPSVIQKGKAVLTGKKLTPPNVFDREKWEDATRKVQTAYSEEGYVYASLRPVVERRIDKDSTAYVDLRWEVDEQTPAIINRVEIIGNDYTTESCIRDQLVVIPGQVFNQAALIRSYQSIGNLGFFETPLPTPETKKANEQGDLDVIFNVKEKRTGNVNFGASMGQGLGVGGFIGLDQPNLFGQCKRGSLQWQFGRYINDFNLTYTDPRVKQTQIQGTVNAHRTLSRYNIANIGRSLSTGGSIQFGFPILHSYYSRLFVSYGAENVSFGSGGLLGETSTEFGQSSFRSTLGFTATHDTRVEMPFATAGSMQTFTAQFNGGPLGGASAFQRYTTELRSYAPLWSIGGNKPGSQPMRVVVGLTSRAGAVAGNTGPFFYSQEFALGGVQFGEMLRGYDEFSISPNGYIIGTSTYNAQRTSFGKAFFTTTAELGLRLNQSLYTSLFYDAGNVYAEPRDFDPSRLFRGAGIGVSTITPLGPLGLDYAYGFDRLDALGRPAPKWQLHFRLGQLF